MVGNEIDAKRAHLDGEYVGEGCSRAVYRIGDVVYKVNTTPLNSNRDEYLAGESLRDTVPHPFVVPPMSLYGDILAMPYYVGNMRGECYCTQDEECDDSCMPPDFASACYRIGTDRSPTLPVRVTGTTLVVTDTNSVTHHLHR